MHPYQFGVVLKKLFRAMICLVINSAHEYHIVDSLLLVCYQIWSIQSSVYKGSTKSLKYQMKYPQQLQDPKKVSNSLWLCQFSPFGDCLSFVRIKFCSVFIIMSPRYSNPGSLNLNLVGLEYKGCSPSLLKTHTMWCECSVGIVKNIRISSSYIVHNLSNSSLNTLFISFWNVSGALYKSKRII